MSALEMRNKDKNKVNGVLLLNKSVGMSSNFAVQKVKHLFNAEKCGHTGTLDPLASGILPLCLGEATKFSQFLLDSDKEYIATIKLGVVTTTYDAEGQIIATHEVKVTFADLVECVSKFLGVSMQTPPIYSALKVAGRPLYAYARSGMIDKIDIATKMRQITLYELEILDYSLPIFSLRVKCSKGTYIRSLAHDIGRSLGCGAYLLGLIRTKTNKFTLCEDLTINALNNVCYNNRLELLLPIDELISDLPRVDLTEGEFLLVRHGNKFYYPQLDKLLAGESLTRKITQVGNQVDFNFKCRIYFKNSFLGVATNIGNNILQPLRLITHIM